MAKIKVIRDKTLLALEKKLYAEDFPDGWKIKESTKRCWHWIRGFYYEIVLEKLRGD